MTDRAARKSPAWRIAKIGVIAAAYAALVYAFPISHMPWQMRIAETLKPLAAWDPDMIPAFVLGNFISNLGSPFVGPWDLAWMPFANLVGAWACWRLGRINAYLGATVYAIVISLALMTMFHFIFQAPFHSFVVPILPVELLLILGGVPVMRPVYVALQRSLRNRA